MATDCTQTISLEILGNDDYAHMTLNEFEVFETVLWRPVFPAKLPIPLNEMLVSPIASPPVKKWKDFNAHWKLWRRRKKEVDINLTSRCFLPLKPNPQEYTG